MLAIDHTSLSSVVAAAKKFLGLERSLHELVNNAGIMSTPYEITGDGYEAQWQVNYLAHLVFTALLLPVLTATARREKELGEGRIRIVNLTSSGDYGAPKEGVRFGETGLEGEDGMPRYGQPKPANILHAKTLHKAYGLGSSSSLGGGKIWVSIVHPGLVDFDLGNEAQCRPWGLPHEPLLSAPGSTACLLSPTSPLELVRAPFSI